MWMNCSELSGRSAFHCFFRGGWVLKKEGEGEQSMRQRRSLGHSRSTLPQCCLNANLPGHNEANAKPDILLALGQKKKLVWDLERNISRYIVTSSSVM